MRERDLAASLHNNQSLGKSGSTQNLIAIGGIDIAFPYQYALTDPYRDLFSFENAQACASLFQTNTLPISWTNFLQEVEVAKEKKGTNYPTDFINGVFFLSNESARYAELAIPSFAMTDHGPDFRDTERTRDIINRVLEDDELRTDFKNLLATNMPDIGYSSFSGSLDMGVVTEVLQSQNRASGILVDLGCGVGQRTAQWADYTGLQTIGIDRNYRKKWYEPFWRNHENEKLSFIKTDFTEEIPLPDDCVTVVVLEDVVPYVLQDKLAATLKQAKRILEPDGFLFVGPQGGSGLVSEWRIFKKERVAGQDEYSLVEHSFSELTAPKN